MANKIAHPTGCQCNFCLPETVKIIHKKSKPQKPLKCYAQFAAALKADPDYARGWHANISCCVHDTAKTTWEAANKAAVHIMKHCFDVDTQWVSDDCAATRKKYKTAR